MQEVSVRVDDIRLTEFILDECHDVGQVRFARVLTIDDAGHGSKVANRAGWLERGGQTTQPRLRLR